MCHNEAPLTICSAALCLLSDIDIDPLVDLQTGKIKT